MLRENFDMVQVKLDLIQRLISLTDIEISQFLKAADVSSSFAVVWLLTWFARVPGEFEDVARITDFIISSDMVYMPVYMAAVAVIMKKRELLAGPCEMATIYATILQQVKVPTPQLISKAWDLYCRLPVQTLLQLVPSGW